MKKTLFLAVTALLTLSSAQAQNTLRLMTYNIKNANGMDNVQNFQRVANVINNACPDAVAIQELDSMTNRSGKNIRARRNSRTHANARLLCSRH